MIKSAQEFKVLFSKFNKGIKSVEIESGIVRFFCQTPKCAKGVLIDALRSKAFNSVKAFESGIEKGLFIVDCAI